MALSSRRARGVFRLVCLLALVALSFLASSPPRSADACLPFGSYTYYNCQGGYIATCYVQTNCGSCCTGPITGWCYYTHVGGKPNCSIMPDS